MPLKTSSEELPAINLTSMIDVLFLLIIFFMVGTRFSESEHQIQLTLPKSSSPTSMAAQPAAKVVTMYSDGSIELEGQRLTADQLTNALIPAVQNYPDVSVQVRIDAGGLAGQFSEVLKAISRAGVKNVGWTMTASRMPNAPIR
ncbi:MAG: ExbD/TolR family protein [Planctomycetota bacterium]|jgi:biopolymer transport protein ExbD